MRALIAAILVSSLLITSAQAGASLPPGKPAGVKQAQSNETIELWLIGGMVALAGGLGILMMNKNSAVSSTSTGSA